MERECLETILEKEEKSFMIVNSVMVWEKLHCGNLYLCGFGSASQFNSLNGMRICEGGMTNRWLLRLILCVMASCLLALAVNVVIRITGGLF
jgi:hypothetical protein